MIISPKVLYTAAHSGFSLDRVPLGGGGTVATWLESEWLRTRPFALRMLRPDLLGAAAPRDKDLVRYSELEYARFCRRFEQATTEVILREDPRQTVVLSNDVSEGPDFRRLSEAGFRVYTIYHVDVVDYFCRIYLRGWIRPEVAVRLYDRWMRSSLRRFMPNVLKLVFQKQADSVNYSRGLIVMSEAMKQTLVRCYPGIAHKIRVFQWGLPELALDRTTVNAARQDLETRFPTPPDTLNLISLSRITPEKGQDRVLRALESWERTGDYPQQGVTYFIVGEAAYMQGKRFETRLRKLAKRLRRTRVYFTGYLAGAAKQAILERGHLYVFPSRHESYGLTLLEAMRAALPVLSTPTYGAQEVVNPAIGTLLSRASENEVPRQIERALALLALDRDGLRAQGAAARRFAATQRFSDTAARLADWLIHHTIK